MKKIKIALICYDNPFLPPFDGGKKCMMSRIKSLISKNKYEIDVYVLNKRNEKNNIKLDDKLTPKIKNIFTFDMNRTIFCLFDKFPICTSKRFVKNCVKKLEHNYYDVAIYEGEQVAKYRFKNSVHAKYHIIYMHDIESLYRKEIYKSQTNIFLKIANYIESIKFKIIENNIDKLFDRVWFISNDECKIFQTNVVNKEKCVYLPLPSSNIKTDIIKNVSELNILYVGDLTIQHNFLSLKWFIENVFNLILKRLDNVTLTIVGNIKDEDILNFNKKNIIVKGYVENIEDEYLNASFVVCPVLYGAGVKVKVIEALGKGQIVVTNKKGIEGTDLKDNIHLIVCDDPKKMSDVCVDILYNRNNYNVLAINGLAFIQNNHTIENQANIIDKEIEFLLNNYNKK